MKTIRRKLCAILCAAVLVGVLTPTASAATFSDVSNHWAASYIETCAGRSIVDGVGGGKFEPEGKVTNAQFVKMLCTAFFDQEQQTHEVSNRAAMDAYFGGNTPWYGYRSYYFSAQGLLNSVDYNIQSATSANQPMNRNNMAQVAANVLSQKGIIANESDRALAEAKLIYVNDYYNIPEGNRNAVATCYALGVITGTDGGKFDGASTMTRAQACTVITRLLDVVGKMPNPDPIVTPDPTVTPEPTVKDIQVTSRTITNGTAWDFVDNGFSTGYLNNGKPITEENVIELLHEAEKTWYNSMTWATNGTANNNCYLPDGSSGKCTIHIPNVTSNYECTGFASLLSYYVFGKNANPVHVVTNFADVRPGDIIKSTTLGHTMVVTDKAANGDVYTVSGNSGKQVRWSWSNTHNKWYAYGAGDLGTFTIYSRYPD